MLKQCVDTVEIHWWTAELNGEWRFTWRETPFLVSGLLLSWLTTGTFTVVRRYFNAELADFLLVETQKESVARRSFALLNLR